MTYNGLQFNGTHITSGTLEMWCNQDRANVYKASKFLVLVHITGGGVLQVTHATVGTATYLTDANGYAIVDLSDLIRAYGNASVVFKQYGGTTSYALAITVAGLINPRTMIIPELADEWSGWAFPNQLYITPPSRMIMAISGQYITFELFATAGMALAHLRELPSGTITDFTNSTRNVTLTNANTNVLEFYRTAGTFKTIKLLPLEECKKYAFITWISATGQKRAHTFEIKEQKHTAKDGYSLLNLAGEWSEVPERVDALTLRIDGLDLYDLWYYSDILTSTNVQVQTEADSELRSVEITDKSVTIPTGGAGYDGVFEFTLNYKKYDAVTM